MKLGHVGAPPQIVIFLGPPGSGKGTQAARLAVELDIPAISTGEMLRQECRSGSKLGLAVQNVLLSGQLVNDDLMNEVVAARLAKRDCDSGCILDGYPRTIAQAAFLEGLLKRSGKTLPIVFNFVITPDAVIGRLSTRRQCAVCGAIGSTDGQAAGVDLYCKKDGTKLVQRADDQPASIRERLYYFERNSEELVRFYRAREYHQISADRPPHEITDELLGILQMRVPAGLLQGQSIAASSAR